MLSTIFANASSKAAAAIHLRGKAQTQAVEDIRTLMSEARDEGLYHRDDCVEMVEYLLAQPKVSTYDLRELTRHLNTLTRCAEWVEHARGQNL